MSKTAKRINNASSILLVFVSILFLLILAAANLRSYLTPKVVLGIKTEEPNNQAFWEDFVNKNPSYIPGWVELGKPEKAKEIDPNFQISPKNSEEFR